MIKRAFYKTTESAVGDLIHRSKLNQGTPLLLILIGPPGSGKTSFRERLRHEGLPFTLVCTDEKLLDPREPVSFEHRYLRAIAYSRHVVVDQTNLTPQIRAKLLTPSRAHFRIAIDCFTEPTETLIARVQARQRQVPPHVIEELADKYVTPTLAEGFDLIYHIEDKHEGT
jgi:predicted kinase